MLLKTPCQVAEMNGDVQLSDFVESEFLFEQVLCNTFELLLWYLFFRGRFPLYVTWIFFTLSLLGWIHKENIKLCCSTEESGKRTWWVLMILFFTLLGTLSTYFITYILTFWFIELIHVLFQGFGISIRCCSTGAKSLPEKKSLLYLPLHFGRGWFWYVYYVCIDYLLVVRFEISVLFFVRVVETLC